MRKVLQTIVGGANSKVRGNCMQAAVASLFDLELNQVPNFIEFNKDWFDVFYKFFQDKGFYISPWKPKGEIERTKEILKHDGGVGGYFYAAVPSQTFKDSTHAVIIDCDMNIVHDPNPNQLALKLTPKDILEIDTVKDDWHIDVDGSFVIER
jgi:hypothetical protein